MGASRAAVLVAFVGAIVATNVRAQDPVAPPAAIQAARAAMTDTVRGAALRVEVLTAGFGTGDVWDRFGHNLLRITDERTGESVVWNWGLFNFDEPGFITRFLFGNTRYLMDSVPGSAYLEHYRRNNREVVAQELALSPGQRAALDALVRVNVRGEDRFYRYDYYLDNCSTRLRDALDIVTDGALRRALELPSAARHTYRGETLRLVESAPWFFYGMDLALGSPADAALTPWQLAFIPMRFRDMLRSVMITGPAGTRVPLVRSERTVVPSSRAALPEAFGGAPWATRLLIGGVLLALLIVGCGMLGARGVRGFSAITFALGVGVHFVFGALATLIVFMWLFTRHTFWAWNHHLLLFTPVSLALVIALPMSRRRAGLARRAEQYHFAMSIAGFAVAVGALVWYLRGSPAPAWLLFAWASVSWLLHLAIGIAMRRLHRAPAA